MTTATKTQAIFGSLEKNNDVEITGSNWGWLLVAGIATSILGFIALSFPFMTTMAVGIFLGWLFLVGGIFNIVHTIRSFKQPGALLSLGLSVLYLFSGYVMVTQTFLSVLTLTMVLSIYFIVSGVFHMIYAFKMKSFGSWGLLFASGFISALFGLYLVTQFPETSLWLLGVMAGVQLVFSGASQVGFSFALRRLHKGKLAKA